MMPIERYYGAPKPYDLRCYSASYAQSKPQVVPKDMKFKTGKSIIKSLSFANPEFQRKKRIASYKMYSAEGKVKLSLRKSFRWLKDKYSQVVYGW